jgi:hypothetical protein
MNNGKKAVLWALMAVVIAAVGMSPAHAQSNSISVDVPFDFAVGTQTLGAGNYLVQRQGGFLSLRGTDGQSIYVLPLTEGSFGTEEDGAHLVFARYGNEAFLNEIVFLGGKNYDLPRGSKEQELISAAGSHEKAIRYAQLGR